MVFIESDDSNASFPPRRSSGTSTHRHVPSTEVTGTTQGVCIHPTNPITIISVLTGKSVEKGLRFARDPPSTRTVAPTNLVDGGTKRGMEPNKRSNQPLFF
jgi:hypothetical protein